MQTHLNSPTQLFHMLHPMEVYYMQGAGWVISIIKLESQFDSYVGWDFTNVPMTDMPAYNYIYYLSTPNQSLQKLLSLDKLTNLHNSSSEILDFQLNRWL